MGTKVCTGCGVNKSLSDYSRVFRTKTRLRAKCKSCCAAYAKATRIPHPKRKGLNSAETDSLKTGKYVPVTDYCDKCKKIVTFYKLKKGKAYVCSDCSRQLYYQAGTIFQGSHTPLSKWFLAYALLFQNNKDVTAKEIERSIDVTYVTACRIKKLLLSNWDEAGKFLRMFFRDEHFKEEVHEEVGATIYWGLTKPEFERGKRKQLMYFESLRITKKGERAIRQERGIT